jgi:Mrp family chromosome partitioning ATPase
MVISGKGGVGKTSVAVNLAATLAQDGHKIGLLDADIHGPNVPKMLGLDLKRLGGLGEKIEPVSFNPNLRVVSMAFLLEGPDTPVVWRGPLKHNAFKQFLGEVNWGDLDYLIVDLPPGTGDEPLSIAQLIKNVDGSIIVTTPQEVSLLDSRKAIKFSQMMRVPVVGIIENMSGLLCPHCGKSIDLFKVGGGEKAAKELMVPFLGRIPIDPEIVQNGDRGVPFVEVMPDSKAAEAFSQISKRCKEFVNRSKKEPEIGKGSFGISQVKEILKKRDS